MLITVSTHTDPLDAHIMRCRLEAEGICAFVAHEHHIQMDWLLSTALGGVKVQVAAADALEAQRVVHAFNTGEYELDVEPEPAPRCGRCGSGEILEDKTMWRISFLSLFLLSIPLPFRKSRMRCKTCGHAAHRSEF